MARHEPKQPYILVATVAIEEETVLIERLRSAGLSPQRQERATFPMKGIDRVDVYVVESEVAEAMRLVASMGYRCP